MKSVIFTITFIFALSIANAQIAEIKQVGNYAKIYNEKGHFTGKSVYISNNSALVGYNNKFIVVKTGNYLKIYNEKGTYTGHSIYLPTGAYVKNVGSTTILIKQGHYVKYYDFEGKFTGRSTYDNNSN